MSVSERLRNFDSHSSVSKEFRVYTVQGAVFSVLTLFAIAYFITTEFNYNFQPTLQERVHVNATSSAGLEMEFDISLPKISCSQLFVDAADPNDQRQSLHLDGDHHVWKHRMKISEDGTRILIGDRKKLELGSTMLNDKDYLGDFNETIVFGSKNETTGNAIKSSDNETSAINAKAVDEEGVTVGVGDCGSCYGAGEEGMCCDTCEEVRNAYKKKGWVLGKHANVVQCKEELEVKEEAGEGCNVHGKVALSTGGGNLHLAPGKDPEAEEGLGFNLFDLLMEMFQQWDVSHTIHKIRFGPEYPAAVYQLDGVTRTLNDTYGMYQYYFQVVPTLYRFFNGTTIQTNQYSVTEHLRHVSPGSGRGMPGVFFFYEVSPLHVEILEVFRTGWIAFLTSVCAIVGGVVTLMGMADQYIFASKHKARELVR